MGEKRTQIRIPLMARIDVLWGDESGEPRVAPATLEDRSRNGLSVQMKFPAEVGVHITIKWGNQQFSGTVTNCRLKKNAYVLGIRQDAAEGRDPK
jgi:hypothetical protein